MANSCPLKTNAKKTTKHENQATWILLVIGGWFVLGVLNYLIIGFYKHCLERRHKNEPSDDETGTADERILKMPMSPGEGTSGEQQESGRDRQPPYGSEEYYANDGMEPRQLKETPVPSSISRNDSDVNLGTNAMEAQNQGPRFSTSSSYSQDRTSRIQTSDDPEHKESWAKDGPKDMRAKIAKYEAASETTTREKVDDEPPAYGLMTEDEALWLSSGFYIDDEPVEDWKNLTPSGSRSALGDYKPGQYTQ